MCLAPLRPGLHIWLWPGGHSEGWKTAREQAARAVDLGAAGVIPQSSLGSARWLSERDQGDSLPRVEVLRQAGLQVTAGFGLDGGHPVGDVVGALALGLHVAEGIMGDWEAPSFWECPSGRRYASAICDRLLSVEPDAATRGSDCPWWKPEVHSRAPTREFARLFPHRFVQAYGTPGRDNPTECTEWMYDHAVASYKRLGISAEFVHPAEQMYGHSLSAAGKLLLHGHSVLALWDVEEMDRTFRLALEARRYLLAHDFTATETGLRAFQRNASIAADGVLGPETLHALGVTI